MNCEKDFLGRLSLLSLSSGIYKVYLLLHACCVPCGRAACTVRLMEPSQISG